MASVATSSSPLDPPTAGDSYAELAELAGRLIHEIKNHLGTLSLNLQLLGEDFQTPENQKERRVQKRIEKLQLECQRLTDLSNDFLRFARVGSLELTPQLLKDVVDEIVDFAGPSAVKANITIKTFLPADLPLIRLDRDLFKQALLNLILNAEQAMPQGGELTIQAESCGNEVALSFIDTGIGMTPDVRAKIFRPFFSTRASGSGLGLPTTRKIIEAHHGRIEVESEPQRGTKFTMRLPTAVQ